MRIPTGPKDSAAEQFPTLRTQHLRVYGAAGFKMGQMEDIKGCPAQYKAKYVDHAVGAEKRSDALTYGSMMHDVLYRMEEEAIGPREALEKCWPVGMGMDHWQEAVDDLDRYLSIGGPMAKFGTVAVEVDLVAPLYEDEDFGPVWFGGRIDWLGIDVNEPSVLHMVDYKTNRSPPSLDDVKGDVQLKGYDWLVRQNWLGMMTTQNPQVVVHLDAIKFRDVEHRFGTLELEEWQSFATAVARKILRDEEGKPSLNPGCSWCPIKWDCKAFAKLPGEGVTLLDRMSKSSLEDRKVWRDEAWMIAKQLQAGIDEVDAAILEKVWHDRDVTIGDTAYAIEQGWANRIDLPRLHDVLGARFYDVVGTSKAALERYASNVDPTTRSAIFACVEREAAGEKVSKRKVK